MNFFKRKIILFLLIAPLCVASCGGITSSESSEHAQVMRKLPEPFVYLNDIDPTILVSLRYLGNENFLGTKKDG